MFSRVANRLPRNGSLILGMRSKSQGKFLPWKTAICNNRAVQHTGYFNLISHDSHQLTDFPALTALLPVITDPYLVLHIHYGCRTSTRHIYVCDPAHICKKEIVVMTYAPTLVYSHGMKT
ncbi:uncharacterized protein TNCV_4562051 [Trichonephila clavipes]|nr:uncharacterized protein TNCV_4562051 [Trichonephila clavipes]